VNISELLNHKDRQVMSKMNKVNNLTSEVRRSACDGVTEDRSHKQAYQILKRRPKLRKNLRRPKVDVRMKDDEGVRHELHKTTIKCRQSTFQKEKNRWETHQTTGQEMDGCKTFVQQKSTWGLHQECKDGACTVPWDSFENC
jgi:hypothetical protein